MDAIALATGVLELEALDENEACGVCPCCNRREALTVEVDDDGALVELRCRTGCAEPDIRKALVERGECLRDMAAALPPVSTRAEPAANGADAFGAFGTDEDGPLGPEPPQYPAADETAGARGAGVERLPPLQIIDPLTLAGAQVPERRWFVPDLIPDENVTLLGGDGAVGKSTLALQLAVASATGKDWLGRKARRCKALVVACEDDAGELHRRLAAVADRNGAGLADLEDLMLICRVGHDNVLLDFPDPWRAGRVTDFYRQLEHLIGERGPELLVLDSLHDVFSGNENVRPHARQFVNALRALAVKMRGAVLLTAHPSLSGRSSGTGESGSTAWSNAVRSRLYLTKERAADGADDPARDRRELRVMKANYAADGGVIRLRWESGVFVPEEEEARGGVVDALTVERDVIEALRGLVANGSLVPASQNATNGLANAVRKLPNCRRYSWAAVLGAQARLTQSGRLVHVELGPPSRRRVYIRPADMTLPGEAKAAD